MSRCNGLARTFIALMVAASVDVGYRRLILCARRMRPSDPLG